MRVNLIILQLTLLMTVQLSLTQFSVPQLLQISSVINPLHDISIEFIKKLLDSIPFRGNVPDYILLSKVTGKAFSSKLFDTASQLGTIIASPLGPIAFPYSLDFDLPSNDNYTYDYVIVGAGAAGSTVAARLTEDPNVRVLVIEAGGKENSFNTVPLFAILQQKTPIDWQYLSEPQDVFATGLNEGQIATARGKTIGGSTSINFMLSVRGNRLDYDRWEELGAKGWNSSAMNPYFIKMEGSLDPDAEPGYHGTKGPMPVSPLQYRFAVDTAFIDGVREYGLSIGDYNGQDQERFQYGSHNIKDGERWSTGRAYLQYASTRNNLHVLLYSHVNKIIFDGKRAVGVKFTNNNKDYQIFARKKVIICAGAIETPKLLMLSGIGPKDHLDEFKIPIVYDSPGVGQNLQDHAFTFVCFKTNFGTSFVAPRLETGESFFEYVASRKGPFTTPGLNANGFYRTKYAEDSRPDIQILEFGYVIGALPDFYLGYILNFNRQSYFKYFLPYSGSDGTMYAVSLVKPRSKGVIKLSSTDPRKQPSIQFNFFEDPNNHDLEAMVEGCKLVLNISNTQAMQSVGAERFNSTLGYCSDYLFDSDDYLRCLIKTLTFTLWHSVGTAKMGSPDDPMAVVDPELHVIGVKDLMIVDTSVMPEVPTGNTATPTIALAYRAVDLMNRKVLQAASLPFTNEDDIIYNYVSI